MAITFTLSRKAPARAELHAVPVASDQVSDEPHGLDWAVLKSRGFEGSEAQVQIVSGENGMLMAAVGVGPSGGVNDAVIRKAAAALARAAKRHKHIASSLLACVPEDGDLAAAAQAHAEGVTLGAYRYDELRSEGKPNLVTTVSVVGTGGAKTQSALDVGAKIAEGVIFARDLVNEPGGSLTPARMANAASRMAKREGLKVEVMDLAAIKKARLGGVLGVNRGSDLPPRFVTITYTPKGRATGHVALVGKGITFDSGGLSIKSGLGMMTMKCDMGGAAAVLGAMNAIKAVAPPCKVTAYVPMTDNMLGGDATRPGDVLKARNGKTIEVLNTDAEGRLILADALSLASEAKPDAIIDLATLTGACMAALGNKYAGVMGNHDAWIGQVRCGAGRADENMWQLPLPKEYRSLLDSGVADMKNIGGPHGGALTAGLFLQEFVDPDIPWAHIDLAGPAFGDGDGMNFKGGTGYGVRLLLETLRTWENPAVPR